MYLLISGAISWSSKKQPIVTLSTTEAELVTTTHCVCQGICIKRILDELGMKQEDCLTVLFDNCSTIKLSKNLAMHGKSKHIDVRFRFLRDLCREGVIELKLCSSENQLTGILTKPLKTESYTKLRRCLGVCPLSEIVPSLNKLNA